MKSIVVKVSSKLRGHANTQRVTKAAFTERVASMYTGKACARNVIVESYFEVNHDARRVVRMEVEPIKRPHDHE